MAVFVRGSNVILVTTELVASAGRCSAAECTVHSMQSVATL